MNFARGNLSRGWRQRLLSQPLDPRTLRLRDADAHAERAKASQRVANETCADNAGLPEGGVKE